VRNLYFDSSRKRHTLFYITDFHVVGVFYADGMYNMIFGRTGGFGKFLKSSYGVVRIFHSESSEARYWVHAPDFLPETSEALTCLPAASRLYVLGEYGQDYLTANTFF